MGNRRSSIFREIQKTAGGGPKDHYIATDRVESGCRREVSCQIEEVTTRIDALEQRLSELENYNSRQVLPQVSSTSYFVTR